jgi:propanol-preferring alcohol dehydrogenase
VKAGFFKSARTVAGSFLQIEDIPRPQLDAGHVLLRVVACGVCRTDLHIVERDLPALRPQLIPGHQIVGEVMEGATADLAIGTRVGVSWKGGVDGDCWYYHHGLENLCDKPTFTGSRWMEATPSTSSRGRTLSFRCLLVWTTFT